MEMDALERNILTQIIGNCDIQQGPGQDRQLLDEISALLKGLIHRQDISDELTEREKEERP
jgi:hypothetical protein